MTAVDLIIGAAVVTLILLPPRWDPAVRLRERLNGGRHDG